MLSLCACTHACGVIYWSWRAYQWSHSWREMIPWPPAVINWQWSLSEGGSFQGCHARAFNRLEPVQITTAAVTFWAQQSWHVQKTAQHSSPSSGPSILFSPIWGFNRIKRCMASLAFRTWIEATDERGHADFVFLSLGSLTQYSVF